MLACPYAIQRWEGKNAALISTSKGPWPRPCHMVYRSVASSWQLLRLLLAEYAMSVKAWTSVNFEILSKGFHFFHVSSSGLFLLIYLSILLKGLMLRHTKCWEVTICRVASCCTWVELKKCLVLAAPAPVSSFSSTLKSNFSCFSGQAFPFDQSRHVRSTYSPALEHYDSDSSLFVLSYFTQVQNDLEEDATVDIFWQISGDILEVIIISGTKFICLQYLLTL